MESIESIFLHVATLSKDVKQLFYFKIGFNFTISVRSIWSDPKTSQFEKIGGMKCINELSHRNFNWLWKLKYAEDEEFDDAKCLEDIKHYCSVYRPVSGEIVEAVKASFRHIAGPRT